MKERYTKSYIETEIDMEIRITEPPPENRLQWYIETLKKLKINECLFVPLRERNYISVIACTHINTRYTFRTKRIFHNNQHLAMVTRIKTVPHTRRKRILPKKHPLRKVKRR